MQSSVWRWEVVPSGHEIYDVFRAIFQARLLAHEVIITHNINYYYCCVNLIILAHILCRTL